MKEIVLIAVGVVRLITLFFDSKLEKDKKAKKIKGEAKDDILAGLANSDPSLITSGFNKLNRLR